MKMPQESCKQDQQIPHNLHDNKIWTKKLWTIGAIHWTQASQINKEKTN